MGGIRGDPFETFEQSEERYRDDKGQEPRRRDDSRQRGNRCARSHVGRERSRYLRIRIFRGSGETLEFSNDTQSSGNIRGHFAEMGGKDRLCMCVRVLSL